MLGPLFHHKHVHNETVPVLLSLTHEGHYTDPLLCENITSGHIFRHRTLAQAQRRHCIRASGGIILVFCAIEERLELLRSRTLLQALLVCSR